LRPASPAAVIRLLEGHPRRGRRWAIVVGAAVSACLATVLWIGYPKPIHLAPATAALAVNPEAERSFKKGQEFAKRRNQDGLSNAIDEFGRAVKLEPRYAPAWTGLADAYSAMGNFGLMDAQVAVDRAQQAATEAVRLDGHSARALGVLGYVYSIDVHRWTGAEPYLQRAVKLDPQDPVIRLWYGAYLCKTGRFDASIAQLKAGLDIDPSLFALNHQLAAVYFYARRLPEYYQQARDLVRLQPYEASAHLAMARAFELQGRLDDAVHSCDLAAKYNGAPALVLCFRASIEVRRGDLARARQLAARIHTEWQTHPLESILLAALYARLGDAARSFEVLNRGLDRNDSSVLNFLIYPYFSAMREDPRYQAFAQKLGVETKISAN
jgi:serine/threonine-protein kinase